MRGYYSYPECILYGPMAPRTLLFIFSWEVGHGRPPKDCDELVEAYPEEVDRVLKDWPEIDDVCNTLRSMRARIILRKLTEEITATEKAFTNTNPPHPCK